MKPRIKVMTPIHPQETPIYQNPASRSPIPKLPSWNSRKCKRFQHDERRSPRPDSSSLLNLNLNRVRWVTWVYSTLRALCQASIKLCIMSGSSEYWILETHMNSKQTLNITLHTPSATLYRHCICMTEEKCTSLSLSGIFLKWNYPHNKAQVFPLKLTRKPM